jgi:1,4-alpha-glucan branching enzyme
LAENLSNRRKQWHDGSFLRVLPPLGPGLNAFDVIANTTGMSFVLVILSDGHCMTSITENGRVQFKFFRPNVDSVRLVGDFDGWDGEGLAMNSRGDGWWTADVRFEAGDYRFRYLADGNWFPDYAAFGVELTKTGCHSILRVPDTTGYQRTFAKKVA